MVFNLSLHFSIIIAPIFEIIVSNQRVRLHVLVVMTTLYSDCFQRIIIMTVIIGNEMDVYKLKLNGLLNEWV